MSKARLTLALASAFLLLIGAGCGGGTGQAPMQTGAGSSPPPAEAAVAPNAADLGRGWVAAGLPSLADVTAQLDSRQSSFTLAEGHRDGGDFDSDLLHSNVLANPPQAIFTPDYSPAQTGNAGLGVALYTFTLPAYTGEPAVLNLDWSDRPTQGQIFIGLSNWDSASWQWISAPADDSLGLPDLSPVIRNDDLCVVAVVLTASGAYILDELQFIIQQPPEAVLMVDVDSGQAPLTVNFDASGSSDADGSITDFEWDLNGDGTYNSAGDEADARGDDHASYEYTEVGSYTAKVRVTDNSGAKDVAQQEINVSLGQPPVADLMASPLSGDKPLMVTFDASASHDPDGSITDYEWDFDADGNFNETNNGESAAKGDSNPPAFTYVSPGDFTPVVRVTDDTGDKDTASVQISVSNSPPNADLQAAPLSGPAPLSVDLDASGSTDPGGSITDYEWDIDGDGTYNEPGYEAGARGDATPATFEFQHPGLHHVRVRVTDDDGAQDTAQVDIDATNDPPTADLQSDVSEGDAPLLVTFDASGSNDTDGSIADIEWDFDGDGVFNETGAEADARGDSTPLAYTYTDPGVYTAKVRVSDNFDATDTAELELTAHGWVKVAVDDPDSADVGYWGDLALVNGHPAIAYRDQTNNSLKYAYSTTATGSQSADWTKITIATPGVTTPGREIALAEVNGAPALTYCDNGAGDLYYHRASTPTGAVAGDWTTQVSIDSANDVGYDSELLVVSGNPAVVYNDSTAGELTYCRSSTTTGSSASDWSTKIDIDGVGATSAGSASLAIVGGNPAVVYFYYDGAANSYVRYCRSSTTTGGVAGDWATKKTLTGALVSGANAFSLFDVAGNPATSWINTDVSAIQFCRATDATGGTWAAAVNVETGIASSYTSLGVVNGNPTIAYHSQTPNDLIYSPSSTATGGAAGDWNNDTVIDGSSSNVGRYATLIIVDGTKPAIYYRDDSAQACKYIVLF